MEIVAIDFTTDEFKIPISPPTHRQNEKNATVKVLKHYKELSGVSDLLKRKKKEKKRGVESVRRESLILSNGRKRMICN